MKLLDLILGKSLSSASSEENRVGVWAGIPILGLDALSSAAYGPEAALTILLPLGYVATTQIGPIIAVIVALLFVLFFSYRQTISAYPNGGGSYIVASTNLGTVAGLFAAAALMLDYVLTVAVGISAGVGALISAVPSLHHHILHICLGVLILITLVNLRGLLASGSAFFVPTYLFVASLGAVLIVGVIKALASGGHPHAVEMTPAMPAAAVAVTPWLLMRAFASGCTAMTGVEAVSNGVQAFQNPRVKKAQSTLGAIVVILAFLLIGVAYLCHAYRIGATDPTSSQYQSVLSQIVAAVVGRGGVYYVTLFSVIAVLMLSANTSFADFPRLCHLLAEDEFLPHLFAVRGRRLVYSTGIVILALACGVLLIIFRGITDRLIPLYAVGAFLAFTLSQAGMVEHWRRNKEGHWKLSLVINGVGALLTGIALTVVLAAKFIEGAWIVVFLIPLIVLLFRRIKRHYQWVTRQVACSRPVELKDLDPPIILMSVKAWDSTTERALRLALSISSVIVALHVEDDENEEGESCLPGDWEKYVNAPLRSDGRAEVDLRIVKSPFRRFILPMLDEVKILKKDHPGRSIAVIIPEMVEHEFLGWALHNQRAQLLKGALLLQGGKDVVVINVPWYLHEHR